MSSSSDKQLTTAQHDSKKHESSKKRGGSSKKRKGSSANIGSNPSKKTNDCTASAATGQGSAEADADAGIMKTYEDVVNLCVWDGSDDGRTFRLVRVMDLPQGGRDLLEAYCNAVNTQTVFMHDDGDEECKDEYLSQLLKMKSLHDRSEGAYGVWTACTNALPLRLVGDYYADATEGRM